MSSVHVQHFIHITLTWKQKADKDKPIVASMAKYYWNDVEMPQTPLYLKETIILKFMDGRDPILGFISIRCGATSWGGDANDSGGGTL